MSAEWRSWWRWANLVLAHAGVPSSTMCMGLSGAGFTCPWPSTVQRDSLCREVHSQVVAALTLEEPYLYGLAVTRGEACGTHAEALTHMHTHTHNHQIHPPPHPHPPLLICCCRVRGILSGAAEEAIQVCSKGVVQDGGPAPRGTRSPRTAP